MIFATVGTHEQQFDRLVKCLDGMKCDGSFSEDVIVQTGYCTYKPQNCRHTKWLTQNEIMELVQQARVVVTHGGPSSFLMALQHGKIPVVVPRRKEFREHINNHQIEFVKALAAERKDIIPIYDIEELPFVLEKYSEIIKGFPTCIANNNEIFNNKLKTIVSELCSTVIRS